MSDQPFLFIGREMTRLERVLSACKNTLIRWRRRLPYLVWYGDEVDVGVCFMSARLPETEFDPADPLPAFAPLYNGEIAAAASHLGAAGVDFDRGMGFDGTDWEWDFSLRGPISVTFRQRAAKPERRRERPRPILVVNNGPEVA